MHAKCLLLDIELTFLLYNQRALPVFRDLVYRVQRLGDSSTVRWEKT